MPQLFPAPFVFIDIYLFFFGFKNINSTPPICLSISSSSYSSSSLVLPCCFSHGCSRTKGPGVHDGMSRWAPNPVPGQLNLRPQRIAALMMCTKKNKTKRTGKTCSKRCPSNAAYVSGDALKKYVRSYKSSRPVSSSLF